MNMTTWSDGLTSAQIELANDLARQFNEVIQARDLELGQILLQAQAELPFGNFTAWYQKSLGLKQQRASELMRSAELLQDAYEGHRNSVDCLLATKPYVLAKIQGMEPEARETILREAQTKPRLTLQDIQPKAPQPSLRARVEELERLLSEKDKRIMELEEEVRGLHAAQEERKARGQALLDQIRERNRAAQPVHSASY